MVMIGLLLGSERWALASRMVLSQWSRLSAAFLYI